MKKILITPSSFNLDFVRLKFKKYKNIKFIYQKGPITNKIKLIKSLKGCDSVIIGSENLDSEIINKLKDIKSIIRFGTSLDNIDSLACKKKRIKIYKLPKKINSDAVARHALTLILSLSQNIKQQILSANKDKWERFMNLHPKNIKIGIFGMGNVGKKVTKMLLLLGYNVFYYSKNSRYYSKKVKYVSSLKKLINKTDLLSIHLKSNTETKKIINQKILRSMKNKYLVNTSRGDLIQEHVLYKLLKKKYILGAGLDVYKSEPPKNISLKLRKLKNVIGTAHSSFYDKYTISKMTDLSLKLAFKSLINKN